MEGELSIRLKGTELTSEESKTWLQKMWRRFSPEEQTETEVVKQVQSIEGVGESLLAVGMTNIVALELNGKMVYSDEEHKEDDLKDAVNLALDQEVKEVFHWRMELEDTNGEVIVNMYNRHTVGSNPLEVNALFEDKSAGEVREFLMNLKDKLGEKFEIDSYEVDVADDDEEEDTEEEETSTEETTPEPSEETKEENPELKKEELI